MCKNYHTDKSRKRDFDLTDFKSSFENNSVDEGENKHNEQF